MATKPAKPRSYLRPMEKKIYKVLEDGQNHTKVELVEALEDPAATWENAKKHITNMRAVLRPKGLDIVCLHVWQKPPEFRLVRLLGS